MSFFKLLNHLFIKALSTMSHRSLQYALPSAVFATLLVSLSVNSAVAKPSDIPIRFAKNQLSTTITGKLSPKQSERWYQFEAASGQYTIINIAPRADTTETANVGVLHMPNGQQDGTKGGIIYQDCLPISGKYRLRIARNLMATQGKTAGYIAEIIILPQYASQALCQ